MIKIQYHPLPTHFTYKICFFAVKIIIYFASNASTKALDTGSLWAVCNSEN